MTIYQPDIQTAFDARLKANFTTCPIRWENAEEMKDDTAITDKKSFIRTLLKITTVENGTVGARNHANPFVKWEGNYVIGVYTEKNIGPGLGQDLIKALSLIFINKTFGGIVTFVPRPSSGKDDKHGYWMQNLFIPFKTDNSV